MKFSIKEAIEFGWRVMRENIVFFISLIFFVVLIYVVPDFIGKMFKESVPLYWSVQVLSIALSMVVGLGLVKISLNFCDGESSGFPDVFSQYPLFLRYFTAQVIYGAIVFAGFLLLIVPGIYFSIRFYFFDYFIVDKNSGVIDSLQNSWEMTRGSVGDLFLFGVIAILINIAGFLALIVGLFATIPTTMVASAWIYRRLLESSGPKEESR